MKLRLALLVRTLQVTFHPCYSCVALNELLIIVISYPAFLIHWIRVGSRNAVENG